MTVTVAFKGESFASQTKRAMDANYSAMAKATTAAANEAATIILRRGREDIAQAGRFGPRWTQGLQATVQPKSGALLNARIIVTHNVDYFEIFETGGTIKGKPFLWIPLSFTGITTSASLYAKAFGGLFYVQPKSGRPLLLSIRDRQPKFFGIAAVNIRKRFHIREICAEVMAGFNKLYAKHLKV